MFKVVLRKIVFYSRFFFASFVLYVSIFESFQQLPESLDAFLEEEKVKRFPFFMRIIGFYVAQISMIKVANFLELFSILRYFDTLCEFNLFFMPYAVMLKNVAI